MKSSNISKALALCIKAKRSVFVWGAPGVGKSDVVRQVAAGLGVQVMDVRASQLDPVDLRGVPTVKDGRTLWAIPDFLPRCGSGVLFFDELNSAPQQVQAACYQLFLDRRLGDYTLPDGWALVAAGNRETDRSVTYRMPAALANRFVHLDFEVHLDDFTKWALQNSIRPEVIAFLRFRPELLHSFDPLKKAFPTPRAWAAVSSLLDAGPDADWEYELLSGTVGEGAAAELVGFLRVFRSLPSPDAVLLAPDRADVPTDPATLYALCGALARKASGANFDRVVGYGNRLPKEFGVLLVRDATIRAPEVQRTSVFVGWAANNSDILI